MNRLRFARADDLQREDSVEIDCDPQGFGGRGESTDQHEANTGCVEALEKTIVERLEPTEHGQFGVGMEMLSMMTISTIERVS